MNSTILVVDSDDSIRTVIQDILSAKGYRVETASSMASASAFLARQETDLVFVAEALLNGDSGTFAFDGKAVPFVLVVAQSCAAPVDAVRESGALTYIKLPVDRNRLEMIAAEGVAVGRLLVAQAVQAKEIARANSVVSTVFEADDGGYFLLDSDAIVMDTGGDPIPFIDSQHVRLVGRPYLSILSGPSVKTHAAGIAKVRANGKAFRFQEKRAMGDVEVRIKPIPLDDELVGFVIRMRDVTSFEQDENRLVESEKQYRSVFDGAQDPIVLIDRKSGALITANGAASRATGYAFEEMQGLTLYELVVYPDRTMQAVGNGVKRIAFEYFRRKDGSSFPVELSLSYFSDAGREVGIMYAQDISRRQVVEEALREGARLYRAVVEDQTELIYRYSPEGKLTFVNETYARFFGQDADDALGTDSFAGLSAKNKRDLRGWLSRAEAKNAVYDMEIQLVRGDGEERWIHWTHRVVLNERQEVSEIQAVGRDVTERKAAETALNKANMEKEQYRLNLIATFKSIPDAILTVDNSLIIMASNRAAARLFDYDKGRMRGLDLQELVGDEGNPCLGVLKQVLRTNKAVRGYEIELDTPAMGARMVEVNCSPLIDQDKQHIGAVLIVRDVSHIVDLEKQLQKRQGFRGIVGSSSAMQDMYQLLEQLSSLDSIVLILGESGTGKELVAEALHYGGSRAGKPLIKVNCSALSESLLESELFGHVRGAFTGAVRDKVGRIQAAQGGTLFLDEIGDISPLLQLKLLRFLEQKEYERVGESRTYSADVRIIAATNVNLLESIRQGAFREDLYYRLNVMPVTLPPLRDRQADIPTLVEHFLSYFSEHFNKPFDGVSTEVMDLFMSYPWPGNVRELRHTLEHACILSPGKIISMEHLRKDLVTQMQSPPIQSQPEFFSPSFIQAPPATPKPTKGAILTALQQCGGNKARAARMVGIHRATLYRKLKAWGLDG
ncbi:sigma 54-interacting transcriptional regulator [Pseudodesulfovibrio sediminis]|uniref:PAS domain S-box-containing protein n=1 Tax=Pseudodesulfovibrio sediminis TaxID=2810563 RepID=A0ABM7P4P2_9BACT|nr:sigma 54-interacting transcriptional regulator [Pseudodesulfovibrio sediminis]BCS87839.1 hypothetical protein PSDVSF_10810 [Pseudodesulfovibrio sediminis]